ncbi:MAG: GTP-binding protein, partial [Planctomycetota bacterium]
MNIVIIGHVDHGKSTLVGRLLADTHSLPEGKLQEVKTRCAQNARPFEYAFLLDALKDEQAQGITIDSARCFFRSDKREYILIDAPGHIEFLKNMVSGAARAEAAVLVIDADEGVQENSRRHGYLLSMLGIRHIVVAVNKMDLVKYSQKVFESVRDEYTEFLSQINVTAEEFIPISAREGDFVADRGGKMNWFEGPTILEALDQFKKEAAPIDQPLRFPVQDIYKFTAENDDRRIVAGQIETGQIHVGDEVVFYPSKKRSHVASIEEFNTPEQKTAYAGQSAGITLT